MADNRHDVSDYPGAYNCAPPSGGSYAPPGYPPPSYGAPWCPPPTVAPPWCPPPGYGYPCPPGYPMAPCSPLDPGNNLLATLLPLITSLPGLRDAKNIVGTVTSDLAALGDPPVETAQTVSVTNFNDLSAFVKALKKAVGDDVGADTKAYGSMSQSMLLQALTPMLQSMMTNNGMSSMGGSNNQMMMMLLLFIVMSNGSFLGL